MHDFILDNIQYIAVAIYIIVMVFRAIAIKQKNDDQQERSSSPRRNQRRQNPDDFDVARRMVEEMIAKKTMQSPKPNPKPAPTPYFDDTMFEPVEAEPAISQEQLLKEIRKENSINQESFDYDSKNDLGNYEYEDISDAPIFKESKSFKIKPNKLREALIMSEILGKPKALREENTI